MLFIKTRRIEIASETKVLYYQLLVRMSLSAKKGWLDTEGHMYFVFPIEIVMASMGCTDQKAENSCMGRKINADLSNTNG